jgi:hypothetical protein
MFHLVGQDAPFYLMDLTGKVRKTQAYYFTNGELADVIWLGEWSRGNLYNPLHFFLSIQPEQRLGFSDGGEGYPRRWQQCGPFRATTYMWSHPTHH